MVRRKPLTKFVCCFNDTASKQRSKMRYLGLDVGDKRIGLALSDENGIIAGSIGAYLRVGSLKKDVANIKEIVAQKQAGAVVVGMPYSMSGADSQQTQRVRVFVEKLKEALDVEIFTQDERLSTVAAERALLEADMSRGKRKKAIDGLAATFILQGFLDALPKNRPPPRE